MQRLHVSLALTIATLAGCAHAPMTYRLTNEGTRPLLVPPGVLHPELAKRTFVAPVKAGPAKCSLPDDGIALDRRGTKVRLTVSRSALREKPAAWLATWAGEAESRGCIAPGAARDLVSAVIDRVPLDPVVSFRLLHASNPKAGYMDLGPGSALEVVAPIMETAPTAADTQTVSGNGNSMNVEIRAASIRGIETTDYAVRQKPGGGYTMTPLRVERRIGGTPEPAAEPVNDYLKFPPSAAFFRLVYKADDNGVTAVVIGAPTHGQLELADCGKGATCVTMPKSTGINPVISITVNGNPVTMGIDTTVRNALTKSGVREPVQILPKLHVSKLYEGRLVPVDFVRASESILDLRLFGGESISF